MRIPLFLLILLAPVAYGQSTYLQVGEAKTKKPVIALTPNSTAKESAKAALAIIEQTVRSDLEFTDQFRMLPDSAFPQTSIASLSELKTGDWAKTGSDYVGFGSFSESKGTSALEFHLASVGGGNEILAKRYTTDSGEWKTLGHTIANDIVFAITGKKGIFLTRIAFVCDKSGKKEIYTSAFDGTDIRQVTRLRSLSMAPSWSPDGTKIAFSVYNRHSGNIKNIDLFEYQFRTGVLKLLSNRSGINSGACFSPDGKNIAYTMSYTGNPEIHLLDLETKVSTQLTRSLGFDVDPAFSPDGQRLAFVSSRPGKPMIYTLDLRSPLDVKRLTYAGAYNATPNWSPDGSKIVFAGWLERHFDLFTITSDGGKIDRLTKDEGNNEDPHYSPDGSFIAFSSTRSGGKNIFVMNSDGSKVRRLTFGMGTCVAPKWSPYLQ
ncbi:MAG: PD40 domain-containing protein [Bdellovibrionales bacterium]|nr:PD40 domain-containing protein [Bdellovibrionales bacterium]